MESTRGNFSAATGPSGRNWSTRKSLGLVVLISAGIWLAIVFAGLAVF